MTKFILYLTVLILLFASKIQAQATSHNGEQVKQAFDKQANDIASNIKKITKEEKSALKIEVEAVNVELQNGKMTKEEAYAKKQKLAEARAKNIEARVAVEQENLKTLVQKQVDGKITETDSSKTIVIHLDNKFCCNNKNKPEKRTTSQFVLAFGANNLVTNSAVANSDFYYWQSHFFEWGFTENTRIFKNHNLLHFKYGFSVMYNNISATKNRYFVPDGNGQTNLEVFPYELEDSRFKNVYLVAPLHLEFDFSGNKSKFGNSSFSTHQGVRFGIGGYGGFRIKSKQKLYYHIDDDKIRTKTKGNFNANDFIYGVSTYLGYKETSLYLKYDLNTLFENNVANQNNISLGVRFDFN
ncbi:hypothetical protein [Flavobacterium soyangense]|uniref:Outer membrane protein beta-barrel domain-containing protein n=1 Tax=Flavobacterium soyangense TaxID=2023265 RepID=A0A930UC71_9FLAO|nr:hypothetical protein [Flavobacterium soyangense]MBF2709385.1 hypothetical protein [Flavobacterium soyangense]